MNKLNSYDWDAVRNHHVSKMEELQRMKEQLRKMANLIDDLESKLAEIIPATDSLPKKRKQKNVGEDLLRQVDSVNVTEIMSNEALEDEYKIVMKRFQDFKQKLLSVVENKRKAYDQHEKFSELCDIFNSLMKRLRELIPLLTQTTNKLVELKQQGSLAGETSNDYGKEMISETVDSLQREYDSLFDEINKIHEESRKLVSCSHNYERKNSNTEQLFNVFIGLSLLALFYVLSSLTSG
ncbi:hypothetical protein B4U80_11720 [Leptotrombidium deliense]|uniref:Uncharacterized protein n=1 Tax=Leptotrombidium deliense TaxID=299467 RepID=A0A443S3I8_9ACAR|nr:hypothetical protein B4U80_11720 [Leptotrombidium deliense]